MAQTPRRLVFASRIRGLGSPEAIERVIIDG
jgi:hypothetical protein